MAETAHVASFRRVTPGIVASARLAMANDVPDISKSEIALLLKRAAPVLGIDGTTYHVMDILLGLSRADDWKGTGRPVVAISNAKLAEYTMRSERTVIRCIKRLVEAGIAAYRDSSTGRRFVYRNDDGEMLSGFGIDFTPARVRSAEIRTAVEQYHTKLNRGLAAKRDIARLSRAIEDLCVAFPAEASGIRSERQGILDAAAAVEECAEELKALHAKLVAQLSPVEILSKMSSEGDIDVTPNINTTQESFLESKKQRPRSIEQDFNPGGSKAAQMAFEKKPGEAPRTHQVDPDGGRERNPGAVQAEVLGSVSIGLLQSACREAQSLTGVRFDSWSALARSGEVLRRMIGLSEAGWTDGQVKIGVHAASAILATVLEKHIRDPDQISKPGGYFRAMVERAIDGRLNLERSLFGLADASYGH
ncbi:plasmid replication protein RepCa2 [Ensifer sp. NM-2]|uniref:plasmid replication protein RepC n=1 Tax=Ensifer sp. NM-2 TaxID=2109730 RepID=UPI000D11DB0E|nr:plasmid replication protein RepC [Ensifer sp. NM-2]PSS59955.1 plasmid replication protein RepCa2 [Ensifer sp. NM-2]